MDHYGLGKYFCCVGQGAVRVRRHSGHPLEGQQAQYGETVVQRVLGNDRFLEESKRKTDGKHEVTVDQWVRVGRHRDGGEPRAWLVETA